ncbi:hypothetical protein O3P69_015336 [Scylla paramamosain]|uniref:Uncharacterized protein n=1 Tax=Scylla paramamosain TaxID=85552 RepID=A0AAW0T3T8_SCYPA
MSIGGGAHLIFGGGSSNRTVSSQQFECHPGGTTEAAIILSLGALGMSANIFLMTLLIARRHLRRGNEQPGRKEKNPNPRPAVEADGMAGADVVQRQKCSRGRYKPRGGSTTDRRKQTCRPSVHATRDCTFQHIHHGYGLALHMNFQV